MTYPSASITGIGARSTKLDARTSRGLLVAVVAIAVMAGLSVPDPHAAATAGTDFTRLLRFMAVLKAGLAAAALGALWWRLAAPIMVARFAAYAIAAGAMTAGPGLIWGMGHVPLGALLLHGGLVALVVLLWRDPGTADRLDGILRRRRRSGR